MFNIKAGNHAIQTLLNHQLADSGTAGKVRTPHTPAFFSHLYGVRSRFLLHFYPPCIFVEQFSRYTRIQYVRFWTHLHITNDIPSNYLNFAYPGIIQDTLYAKQTPLFNATSEQERLKPFEQRHRET